MAPRNKPARTRFFVAAHKPWPLPQHRLYTAIGLGGHRPDSAQAVCDAEGEHIADRNPHYSELTGWYWIWKNVRDADTVGLCHYRRYFFLQPRHPGFGQEKVFMDPTADNMAGFFSHDPTPLVAAVCKRRGIIVPRPTLLPGPISWQYAHCHRREDWLAFLEAIAAVSPTHARHMHIFDSERRMYLYNMMIAPWGFFDDYMAVLTAVLAKADTLIRYPEDPYQRRIPAFLAERFFTLHLHTVNPNLWEVPVLLTDRTAN